MGGYCSIGSEKIESPPASMIRRAMTIAKIGRSMKNLAIGRALVRLGQRFRRGGVHRSHQRPRLHLLHARDDDALAVLQAAVDHPVRAQSARGLDRAQL